jgi:hypothetical protein
MRKTLPKNLPKNAPTARAVAPAPFHGIVSTILLIALSLLIVRDVLLRRWSSVIPPAADVTRRLP